MRTMRHWLWTNFLPKSVHCLLEGYGPQFFRQDFFAGLTVGVVALPLAMAFAIASGVPPERGLYTAIVAGFLISAFSGSRYQIGGPTGAFVVIVSSVVVRHGYDGLALATLMAGGILLVIAFSGLGRLIQFIPYPVTTGFTAGIALIIFSSQVKDFLGLGLEETPAEFLPKWVAYAKVAGTLDVATTLVGVGSLVTLVGLRRLWPRFPGPIAVVAGASAVVAAFDLPVATIGSRFGEIPSLLPAPQLPTLDWERMRALVPDATTIAVLAAIESLLSAVVADGMTGDRHKPSAELLGQGLANIASVVFGGIPATGAIARTATNIRAGAHTPLAGIIHAATLLGFMLVAAPLAKGIPLATLAAILIVVAYNMSEMDKFVHLFNAPRSDVIVLFTTFLLTVLVDLNTAIEVGFILAALLFMRRMIAVSDIGPLSWLEKEDALEEAAAATPETRDVEALASRILPAGVEVYEINGPFFFGIADRLKAALDIVEPPPRVFILRVRRVPAIDATGLYALRLFLDRCRKHGTTLVLSGVQEQPQAALRKIGLDREIGPENICPNIDSAIARAQVLVNGSSASPDAVRAHA